MRLLLDTNILVAIVNETADNLSASYRKQLADAEHELIASVASVWEIAIKSRLGKLSLDVPLDAIPGHLAASHIALMDIGADQVLVEAQPVPDTRDPFDRLLLAICLVEQARLLTTDRRLRDHPLAWRPS